MSNSITITVEDLPPMTAEQADNLRRRLKRVARETVEAFVLSPDEQRVAVYPVRWLTREEALERWPNAEVKP